MSKDDIIAITGGTGFLGRCLVDALLIKKKSLSLLLRNKNKIRNWANGKVDICEGNLLMSKDVDEFLRSCKILIHLAYLPNDGEVNIQATQNLINAIKKSRIRRVVYCSTAVVIGFKTNEIITEKTLPRPQGKYQNEKLQIEEMLCRELLPDVELAILRPTEIIGPGGKNLQNIIKLLKYGAPYKKFMNHFLLKNRRFNFVSVHNVVAALILLVFSSIKQMGEVYIISDDDDENNNYTAVEKIIKSNLKQDTRYCFDIGVPRFILSVLFGFLPKHSPPDREYSSSKIASLGYKKVMALKPAIAEIMARGINSENS